MIHEFYTSDLTPFTLRVRYRHHAHDDIPGAREHCEVENVFMGEKSIWYELEWEAEKLKTPATVRLLEELAETCLADYWDKKRNAVPCAAGN